MTVLLLLALLQAPQEPPQAVDLPVSLDRVREGLARSGRFEIRMPRWQQRRPIFRTNIVGFMPLEGNAWDYKPSVPFWVQPSAPLFHVDFLESVAPDEVRSSTVQRCCDVMPVVASVSGFVGRRVEAAKQGRAKREVEKAMRAAGIRR